MERTSAAHATGQSTYVEVERAAAEPSPAPMSPRVAETMRRVHAQRRNGAAPSYESLMALGLSATA